MLGVTLTSALPGILDGKTFVVLTVVVAKFSFTFESFAVASTDRVLGVF